MGGGTFSKYIMPALETVGGAASEVIAPGNPIGMGLIGSGAGQLIGGAAGGNSGQALGGGLGGMLGGFGGGGGFGSLLGGSAAAGNMGTSMATSAIGAPGGLGAGDLSSALSSSPSLFGLNPNMVLGTSDAVPMGAPSGAGGGSAGPWWGNSALNTLGGMVTSRMSRESPQISMPTAMLPPSNPLSVTPIMGTSVAPQGNIVSGSGLGGSGISPQLLALLERLKGMG